MTARPDSDQARELRRALANTLVAEGAIRSEPWYAAFTAVPRHLFLPDVIYLNDNGAWVPVTARDPDWLPLAYSSTTLVTQLDTGARPRPQRPATPTSSTTTPALMAVMLEALDVHDGQAVLEVGTGTGYNAALLCHRLGDHLVTTVEIDPDLARHAQQRLSAAGYTPTVAVGDGAHGYPQAAPYDRVIATCSLPELPPAWLAQTRPGGLILLNVYSGLNSGALARLVVHGPDRAEGHFLADHGSFMPTRTRAVPGQGHDLLDAALRRGDGTRRSTTLAADVLEDHDFALLVDFLTDATDLQWFTPAATGRLETWLLHPDGSWACLTGDDTDNVVVEEGGPRQLWAQVEAAHRLWCTLGRPTRDRFGLTATPAGLTLWLDRPDSGHAWQLA